MKLVRKPRNVSFLTQFPTFLRIVGNPAAMRLKVIQLWLKYFNFAYAISKQILNEISSLFFKFILNALS